VRGDEVDDEFGCELARNLGLTSDIPSACVCPLKEMPGWNRRMANVIRSKAVVRWGDPLLTQSYWNCQSNRRREVSSEHARSWGCSL